MRCSSLQNDCFCSRDPNISRIFLNNYYQLCLRVTLACARVGAARGKAGQRCNLLFPVASGDRMCSHLLATYMCTCHPEHGLGPWQNWGACAAWLAPKALWALEVWEETLWGAKKHVTLQPLVSEAFLSAWCLSGFHCSMRCQPLFFGDALKQSHQYLIFSLSQDLPKISFAFTARVRKLQTVKDLFLTLFVPPSAS